MLNKYIHIGFPKNLSTTLQRDFFAQHPQILHLGIGCGSNVAYVDAKISAFLENFLIYANSFSYRQKSSDIAQHFAKWFEKAEKNIQYRAVGISLEHLSFSFTPDNVDAKEKAKRLYDIFGLNTKIIMIIRNQLDLLKSLYRESVRMGYHGSFRNFAEYVWIMKDRNFFYEFSYDLMYALYAQLFGEDNIQIMLMEEIRDEDGDLIEENKKVSVIEKICRFIGCDYINLQIGHYNEALDETAIVEKSKLNKHYIHELGNAQYGRGANFHRLKHYMHNEMKMEYDEAFIYKDVRVKRETIRLANKNKKRNIKIDYSIDKNIAKRIFEYYSKSNNALEFLTNRNLPESYFQFDEARKLAEIHER